MNKKLFNKIKIIQIKKIINSIIKFKKLKNNYNNQN